MRENPARVASPISSHCRSAPTASSSGKGPPRCRDDSTSRFMAMHLFRSLALSSRSEEHTSELQSLMRISYAVFCLTKHTTIHHKSKHLTQANRSEHYTTSQLVYHFMFDTQT